jgi:uncharacterized protein (DUF1800 family)
MTARNLEAALALHRFGFGPVAGSIAAIADDPRGALLADLERPSASTRRLLSAPITSGRDGSCLTKLTWVAAGLMAAAAILRFADGGRGNR